MDVPGFIDTDPVRPLTAPPRSDERGAESRPVLLNNDSGPPTPTSPKRNYISMNTNHGKEDRMYVRVHVSVCVSPHSQSIQKKKKKNIKVHPSQTQSNSGFRNTTSKFTVPVDVTHTRVGLVVGIPATTTTTAWDVLVSNTASSRGQRPKTKPRCFGRYGWC